MSGLEFRGLEEFQEDIEKLMKKYPEEASKKVYYLSGRFTKDVNAKFPPKYSTGKRSLPKSWKRERVESVFGGYTIAVDIRNTAPHFHLVENGHEGKIPVDGYPIHLKARRGTRNVRKVRLKETDRMRSIGFVPGKHYCERTRNEWREKYPREIEGFLNKMLGDARL